MAQPPGKIGLYAYVQYTHLISIVL